jgi:hypothetical protein
VIAKKMIMIRGEIAYRISNPSPHSTGPLSGSRAAFDPVTSLGGQKTWEPVEAQ